MSTRAAQLIVIFIISVAMSCSGRFVPREPLGELNKKWSDGKVYRLKKDIDVGNGETMPSGTKVRIWIESDSISIKVKAYKHSMSREKAIGKNIVFMYEAQFKNDEFDPKVFEKELAESLEPVSEPANDKK